GGRRWAASLTNASWTTSSGAAHHCRAYSTSAAAWSSTSRPSRSGPITPMTPAGAGRPTKKRSGTCGSPRHARLAQDGLDLVGLARGLLGALHLPPHHFQPRLHQFADVGLDLGVVEFLECLVRVTALGLRPERGLVGGLEASRRLLQPGQGALGRGVVLD